MPLTVGGGIRAVDDMRVMLRAGADKVGINTAAVKNPEIISEGASAFGSQCIVVAIDAKKNPETNSWQVYTHGGRTPIDLDAIEWAGSCSKHCLEYKVSPPSIRGINFSLVSNHGSSTNIRHPSPLKHSSRPFFKAWIMRIKTEKVVG